MSTFTPRLNLEMPDPNESMALGDDILAANYSKIDAAMGTTVDSGQPGSPFPGQMWSARDTEETTRFFYNGNWNLLGDKVIQRGFDAYDVDGTVHQATNSVVNVLPFTFEAKAGREYWVEWSAFFKFRQPGIELLHFRFIRLNDNTQIHQRSFGLYSGSVRDYGQSTKEGFIYKETVDRTVSIMMRMDSTDANGFTAEINTSQAQTNILVWDWGEA